VRSIDRVTTILSGFVQPFPKVGLRKAFFGQILLVNPLLFLILTSALGGTVELRERWTACVIVADIVSSFCFAVGGSIHLFEKWQATREKIDFKNHTSIWHFLISLCAAPLGLVFGYKVLWLVALPLQLGTPRETSFADFRVAYFIAATAALFIFLVRRQFEVNVEIGEKDTKRFIQEISSQNVKPERAHSESAEKITEGQSGSRFTVRHGAKIVVVKANEISAVLARGRYSGLIVNGNEILTDETLEELTARLDPNRFFRIHRSAIISLEHLKELKRVGDRRYFAVLNDACQTKVPVSRDRLPDLKEKLGVK
jgi:DNA-binding LytR/AlgR family response regulator